MGVCFHPLSISPCVAIMNYSKFKSGYAGQGSSIYTKPCSCRKAPISKSTQVKLKNLYVEMWV